MNYKLALEKINSMSFEEKKEMKEKMISQVEIAKVEAVIASLYCSFEYDNMVPLAIEEYLHQWAMAKMPYFLIFGEKLKVKSERKTQEYDYSVISKDVLNMIETLSDSKTKNDFNYFLKFLDVVNFDRGDEVLSPLFLKWIVENKISYPQFLRRTGDMSISKIKDYYYSREGTKFSKFVFNSFKDKELDSKLSKIIYDIKMMGRKDIFNFLSIDPMDFLFASTNKNNWISCMFLESEYDQRFSVMSYLLDETTIIQYTAREEMVEYLLYEDNSNELRTTHLSFLTRRFVYVSEDIVLGSRSYPHISEEKKNMYDEHIAVALNIGKVTNIQNTLVKNLSYSSSTFSRILNSMEECSTGIYFDGEDPLKSYSFFLRDEDRIEDVGIPSVGTIVPLIRDGERHLMVYLDIRDEDDEY